MKYLIKLNINFITAFIFLFVNNCNVSNHKPSLTEVLPIRKNLISGVNMEAPPNPVDSSCFTNMHRIGAKWVSIIPFAFSRQGQTIVRYNESRQWWVKERKE